MHPNTPRASAAILVVVAAVGWWALRDGRADVATPPSPSPAAGGRSDAVPLLEAPPPTRSPTNPQAMIRYPDGTYMPALNGVKYVPALQWPGDLPFSPVVGKRVSVGTEWYVHADGTQTTSMMMWRSDLGREDAVCHVARPMPVAPEESPEGGEGEKK